MGSLRLGQDGWYLFCSRGVGSGTSLLLLLLLPHQRCAALHPGADRGIRGRFHVILGGGRGELPDDKSQVPILRIKQQQLVSALDRAAVATAIRNRSCAVRSEARRTPPLARGCRYLPYNESTIRI
ncbi:hypothetical protein B0T14DRAFT_286176 [Immersiella caudata]|uniref:Uncharacterized protein n=1 Tax=Immersiella caudata TaxID=314043 RepID=A0AA40BU76_9PEZI|nr:hypothetical protein B0T14DRAFT_286176 [Immersiella caudata]